MIGLILAPFFNGSLKRGSPAAGSSEPAVFFCLQRRVYGVSLGQFWRFTS